MAPLFYVSLLFTYLLYCSQMARHSHTAVEWMGNMVIFGGELANGLLASDVWMYRPLQDDWQQLGFSNSHGAPKLANHAAAVVDSYLYVFGGGSHLMFPPIFNLFFSWFCIHPNTNSLFVSQVAPRRTCFPRLCIGSVYTALGVGRPFSPPVENPQPPLDTPWCSTAPPGRCWSTGDTGLPLPGRHLTGHSDTQSQHKEPDLYRQWHVCQYILMNSVIVGGSPFDDKLSAVSLCLETVNVIFLFLFMK